MLNCTPLRMAMALACVASLAACSSRSGAEEVVRQNLKDPDTARFGDFYFNDKTQKGCLTVNAKNSMGGYTGDQQASVWREDGEWHFGHISEYGTDICRSVADKAD